eukprot:6183597-Pyramimonas_sp.AAC.1
MRRHRYYYGIRVPQLDCNAPCRAGCKTPKVTTSVPSMLCGFTLPCGLEFQPHQYPPCSVDL